MSDRKFDYADIAVALLELARLEAWNVEGCEHLVAFQPRDMPVHHHPGINHALAGLRRRAELVGAAHRRFKAMAPYQAEIEAFLKEKGVEL